MSILVEIAQKADVSVEGVVRVLTREPVSEDVLERVLGVLDDLDPEQTRAVQRFALAALHDVLPRPVGPELVEASAVDAAAAAELPPAPVPAAASEPERLPAAPPDAALVQLSGVLSELAEAVRDLRRETDAERRERVDDLAVLIDLITTGWQGLDARLGRIERQLSRMDAARKTPTAPPPGRPTPVLAEPAPAEPEPAPAPEAGRRSRLPLTAALTLAGALIGTFAVLQLLSGGPDVADLVSARDDQTAATPATQPAQGRSSTTGGATTPRTTTAAPTTSTQARPPATRQPAPATTSSVLDTSPGETQPRPKPPASRPAPAPATRPTTTAAGTAGFKPTRNWAWAPVPAADYYSVEFTRGGQTFYRATPAEPRLTLPSSVVFRPGSYRWIVRAGFGAPAAKRLGAPIVNSGFTVS